MMKVDKYSHIREQNWVVLKDFKSCEEISPISSSGFAKKHEYFKQNSIERLLG